jgi:thymidylate synthase ThyX
MFRVLILCDSISKQGARLTTFELQYPRFIHSELMTHRNLSRNAASSRAIPNKKILESVTKDPAMPIWWGKNQPGMQANEEVDDQVKEWVKYGWLYARDQALSTAEKLSALGLHKQVVNRILEPYFNITTIVSGTDFGNFFNLRCHKDAQPEFKHLADMMDEVYHTSTPTLIEDGDWHLPLIFKEDINETLEVKKKLSTARCARVSYVTHDGRRDIQADLDLHDKLSSSGHWSPFEHVATPMMNGSWRSGNFRGWQQYRKEFVNENRPGYTSKYSITSNF